MASERNNASGEEGCLKLVKTYGGLH